MCLMTYREREGMPGLLLGGSLCAPELKSQRTRSPLGSELSFPRVACMNPSRTDRGEPSRSVVSHPCCTPVSYTWRYGDGSLFHPFTPVTKYPWRIFVCVPCLWVATSAAGIQNRNELDYFSRLQNQQKAAAYIVYFS